MLCVVGLEWVVSVRVWSKNQYALQIGLVRT